MTARATLTLRYMNALNKYGEQEEPELLAEVDSLRPKTRADCVGGARPCVFVSCKHNLYLDVSDIGSIKLNFPELELHELEETCALDVADRGGITLESVGALLSITRERVRQIEEQSAARLRGKFEPDLEPIPPTTPQKQITEARRKQLRAAKKKWRQGNGREKTNAARVRSYAEKKATP